MGDYVKQKIPVVERVDIHVFPRGKFGLILAKNNFLIKIFFALEQYAPKLISRSFRESQPPRQSRRLERQEPSKADDKYAPPKDGLPSAARPGKRP
jgi:hypothetical protein